MRLMLIGLAAVTLATAQNSRSFHLTQNETADQMNQIATLIRSTGGIQQIWADDLQRTVSVTGTSAQLDMAAWYVKQLDRATPPPSPQDYQAGSDDTVRMFFLSHVSTAQQLQEVVTNLRAIIDIKRLFIYDTLHAVAMRGPGSQIAMATWYVKQLDRATPPPSPQDYQAGSDDTVRMFFLPNPSRERLNKAATQVRTTARVQRLFTYGTLGALAVRGTLEQLATAEKVIEEIRTSQ